MQYTRYMRTTLYNVRLFNFSRYLPLPPSRPLWRSYCNYARRTRGIDLVYVKENSSLLRSVCYRDYRGERNRAVMFFFDRDVGSRENTSEITWYAFCLIPFRYAPFALRSENHRTVVHCRSHAKANRAHNHKWIGCKRVVVTVLV